MCVYVQVYIFKQILLYKVWDPCFSPKHRDSKTSVSHFSFNVWMFIKDFKIFTLPFKKKILSAFSHSSLSSESIAFCQTFYSHNFLLFFKSTDFSWAFFSVRFILQFPFFVLLTQKIAFFFHSLLRYSITVVYTCNLSISPTIFHLKSSTSQGTHWECECVYFC